MNFFTSHSPVKSEASLSFNGFAFVPLPDPAPADGKVLIRFNARASDIQGRFRNFFIIKCPFQTLSFIRHDFQLLNKKCQYKHLD